jgi:hypothetical protein
MARSLRENAPRRSRQKRPPPGLRPGLPGRSVRGIRPSAGSRELRGRITAFRA